MTKRFWQPWEREAVEQLYPHVPTGELAAALGRPVSGVYRLAQHMALKKTDTFLASPLSGRLRNGSHPASVAHRFTKGMTPFNKGLRRPGYNKGRMRTTQFKRGSMSGAAQHNYVPIGTLRIKDGVLARKTTDDQSIVPAQRWKPVHTLLWIATHGPVPKGHIVVFKPGLKTMAFDEITLDRIECISRVENMRRNSYHTNLPPEARQVVQLRGALNRMINRRGRVSAADVASNPASSTNPTHRSRGKP